MACSTAASTIRSISTRTGRASYFSSSRSRSRCPGACARTACLRNDPTRTDRMKRTLAVLAAAFSLAAQAQTYPSRPVKLVVPFPAGSATDQVARLVGQQLQEELKQPFIVENKPGAQGAIAAAEVARAAPDGYTLLVTTNTPQAANVSLFKKLPYDPVKDFAPVARIGTTSFMLMVKPEYPAKDLKAFLAYSRSRSQSAGYGSSGSQV